jgi:hypothetical protein
MKKIITILVILTSLNIFSQEKWKTYLELPEGVSIFYKTVECHDYHNGIHKELILFKLENKSEQDYQLEWDFALDYGKQDGDEYKTSEQHRSVKIKGNSEIESSCNKNMELTIFSRHLNYPELSELIRFELRNIRTTPIKL